MYEQRDLIHSAKQGIQRGRFFRCSRTVSGLLYECESKAKDDYQRTRLGTEAITVALLGILQELQEIHKTLKGSAPIRDR
jgi:hypothetical protein